MRNPPRINPLLLIMVLCALGLQVEAQVRPGIKFGVSTPDVSPSDFTVTDDQGVTYYDIFVDEARYGIHAGIFIQMQMGHFFIQPEALFNSTSVDYRVDDLQWPGTESAILRDSYRNVDVPVIMGLKSGAVRLGLGPVAHIFLNSDDALAGYPGFKPRFEDLTWGWQTGLGLDFWKLHIDLRYEGNFSRLGERITFFGKNFDFATDNNRLIGSLGLSF